MHYPTQEIKDLVNHTGPFVDGTGARLMQHPLISNMAEDILEQSEAILKAVLKLKKRGRNRFILGCVVGYAAKPVYTKVKTEIKKRKVSNG